MTKQEFISELRKALSGELPESEIRQHIDYYDIWLTNKAKSVGEEGATEELGSPLLIAKTLINEYKMQHRTNLQYDYNAGTESSSKSSSGSSYNASGSENQNSRGAGSNPNNSDGYTASYDFNTGSSSGNSYGSSSGSYSESSSNGKSYSSGYSGDNVEDSDDEYNRRNKNHFIINGKTVNSVWARLGCLGCAILMCLILFIVARAIIRIAFPVIIVAVLIFMAISLFKND